MTRLQAAVFDMDGTLVDNMRFHAAAWVAISQRLGLNVPAERFEREFAGKKNEEIFPLLLGRPLPDDELARLADEKESLYRSLYAGHLVPLAGALELLERLAQAGIRRAVATAAPPANRDFVLDGLRLRDRFEHIIGAEDVTRGKPHPDVYLKAAATLGVAPGACVAFEDAINGILSAKAAGMRAVGVTTIAPEDALRQAGADWIVRDFVTLPEDLAALLFGSA
jgi:beta-phosphoglucomutase family hydrolase